METLLCLNKDMKHQFKSNQEFYDHIDALCLQLREAGFMNEANQLWTLIHKVAWTTSTELFGELRNAFRAILANSKTALPGRIQEDLKACICVIRKAR